MLPAFVAVDWGTSNRRCYRIARDGSIDAQTSDNHGVLSISDFPAEIAALRQWAGPLPLLLAGTIGSNRGWVEVPYVATPATLEAIADAVVRPLDGVAVVPGVVQDDAGHPDIMRGEEVQLFGARKLGLIGDGLVCHPGTHSKWIEVENAAIVRFQSIMTGDLLAALKAHSILSDLLVHEPADDDAFLAGVDHALDHADLPAALFSVRARVITGLLPASDAASRISGLLIGTDIRIGLGHSRQDVVPLIGAPGLCQRFARALERAGRKSLCIDGETAFIAGARAIMAEIA